MPSSSDHYEATMSHIGTGFRIFPLRLFVFFAAIGSTFFSLLFFLDLAWWEDFADIRRKFAGGYCNHTRIVVGVVECLGVVAGICGIYGTWHVKRKWLVAYNLWQFVQIATYGYMYCVDVPNLLDCSNYITDVDAVKTWEETVYEIAVSGRCVNEEVWFFSLSLLTLVTLMYTAWKTYLYHDKIGYQATHLLRIKKDHGSGAFEARSWGDISNRGQQPVMEGPPPLPQPTPVLLPVPVAGLAAPGTRWPTSMMAPMTVMPPGPVMGPQLPGSGYGSTLY
uniref:Uncharacterized protein n=1 Tax=Noctiluca scintillans TaxID=2966 RepID=A0A7S1AIL9_NOCSC|mmetsp:Transcript_47916/g.126867  ORF Transcript_47916/g.126867 Transcript_47916/m.126867 type:complete len:279 (+) Transcript_47916:62-898(+)